MEKVDNYEIQFVGYMPDEFKQGILYVSMRGKIVIHLCACGCGEKVVAPISLDDWKLTFDGESISLYPSIGNWDFPCKSHYWIRNNQSVFVQDWREKPLKKSKKKSKKKKFFRFWEK
jgi:hypothetical protein